MKKIIFSTLVFAVMAAPALANVSFGDGGAALQAVFNDITVGPNAGTSSVNVATDMLSDTLDSYWSISASGGAVTTMIIEVAGYAGTNTFGIYDRSDHNKKVEVFAGNDSSGARKVLSILDTGMVQINFQDTGVYFAGNMFGFYLDSTPGAGGGLWYSDTSLNIDGADHMAAYQGNGVDTLKIGNLSPGLWVSHEYILAWEDLDARYSGFDADYNDMVIMIESVTPVIPAPGALLLSSLGVGLVGWLRRRSIM